MKKIIVYFLILLMIRGSCAVQPKVVSCTRNSMSMIQTWKFEKTSIVCTSQSFRWLCKNSIFTPKYVICHKDEDEDWTCEADNEWIADASLDCPLGHSTCSDSIEQCRVTHDPLSSIVYIISVLLLVFVGCLCVVCAVIGTWATHCFFVFESSRPSRIEEGLLGVKKVKRQKRVQ